MSERKTITIRNHRTTTSILGISTRDESQNIISSCGPNGYTYNMGVKIETVVGQSCALQPSSTTTFPRNVLERFPVNIRQDRFHHWKIKSSEKYIEGELREGCSSFGTEWDENNRWTGEETNVQDGKAGAGNEIDT